MNRTALIAIGAAAMAATVAGVSSAGGATPKKAVTLTLTTKLDQANVVDNPPSGRSAGDVVVFTEQLFDTHGRSAGTDAASCTALFDDRSLCTGVYVLKKGQVMVQLVQPGPTGTYRQAIVGGTGDYEGARGTAVVVQSAGKGDRITLRMRFAAR
jgi:hypothetical protein